MAVTKSSSKLTPKTSKTPKKKGKGKKVNKLRAPRKKKAKTPTPKTPKETVEVNAEETVVVKPRVFNNKPVLAATTGINISPAKVKNVVDVYVLNRDAHLAITELSNAAPRVDVVVDAETKVETSTKVEGTPVAELSQKTRDYVAHASNASNALRKCEFARKHVLAMSADVRAAYTSARTEARKVDDFDADVFNVTYDADFYKDFSLADDRDEWSAAIDHVSKLKNRFSTNSRLSLSAFVERIIKQLAHNGTVNCIKKKKKIIQLEHALDMTGDVSDQFTLHPLITNLHTYQLAQKYLADPDAYVKALVGEGAEKGKVTDLFVLPDVPLKDQYKFKYYIFESCREVRMKLAQSKDADGKEQTEYNYTNVSKIFKNFCSTLVFELLTRVGHMLAKEIETRGIKTVNDVIIETVITSYHIVCGVDHKETLRVCEEVTKKYLDATEARRVLKRESVDAEGSSELKYED